MDSDSELNDDLDYDEMDDPIGRPKCPFCKSTSTCKHLIFEYDLSFCERQSGRWKDIDALRKKIEDGFLYLLSNNKKVGFIEQYRQHCEPDNLFWYELWSEAEANYQPDNDSVDFSTDNLVKLLIYIFDWEIEDGIAFIKRYGSGSDAPGFDSAMVACFADNAPKRLKGAADLIKGYLNEIEFDTDDPIEYNRRGLYKSAKGHNYDAITDFSKALYFNPEYAEAFYNRGNAKCAVWDEFAAEYDYLKAIKFDPQNEKYQKKIKELEKSDEK